ncbi:NAD-dependent epimerase/dehydratase [Penicillium malachiteum]|nr:NAD-dependent epimerase/dehydratase [Penicillium malachiteum]
MADRNIQENLLITGVSGYIGFKTLTLALERGYHVRAIVRKSSDIEDLKRSPAIASSLEREQLEIFIVPEFLKKDAFLECLDGIEVIIHIASPLAIETDDYDADIIKPAVSMVTTVLEAAACVSSVRRVILTSSCVTLIPFEWNMDPDSERLYNVDDVNSSVEGPFLGAMQAYWASKALARDATKSFIQHNKPQFDTVSLLPSVVIGPDHRLDFDSSATTDNLLQGARASVLACALSSAYNSSFPYVGTPVHVADVARAHVDAIDAGLVSGNSEFILSSNTPDGVVWDKDVRDICIRFFPEEVSNGVLPLEGSLTAVKWRLDTKKTEQVFGWSFVSFEDTMKDLVSQYLRLRGKNM